MTPNHQTILALARAGNPVRAWSLFNSGGLKDIENDPKILTLKGRLLKDLARRARGDERARLYSQASDAYLAANALGEDSYPLINAAALACFAGDDARAGHIAQQVLTLIETNPAEGETAYWREATRAEAHLLLRQIDQATAALARAYKKLPFAHEDQAATLGQFDRILEAQSEDASWLEPFRVPCSVNFASQKAEKPLPPDAAPLASKAIATALETLSPGYGFSGLLSAADLLFSEELIAQGAELFLTFPSEPDEIARSTFAPLGANWEKRYRQVIAKAGQVEFLPCAVSETPLSPADACSITQIVSMGQSLRRSEALRARAHCLVLSDNTGAKPPVVDLWSKAGLPIVTANIGSEERAASKSQSEPMDLCGLIMTSDPQALAPYAKHQGLAQADYAKSHLSHGPLDAVLSAALECAQSTDAVLAVHLGHPASQPVWEGLGERMERLTRANHRAKIKMGTQSAMIAKIVRPSLRIEELGEIQTLSGHASIWSAA